MNTIKFTFAALPLCALLFGCASELHEERDLGVAEQANGNGAPSGSHHTLNIIGVPKGKNPDMTGNSGSRIFVPLDGPAQIYLAEGPSFNVLDANGTDANGAKFELPAADADNDGITSYSVFARPLGTPGGSSTTTTCMTETVTSPTDEAEEYCSVYSMELDRTKGKQTFTNVSKELLYVYADVDGDGDIDRVPLFADGYENFLWDYDNNGLKVAQLRFYDEATNVN
ncbi:hypothetical protein [Polyangium jinanense]|uniref:Lipoprotein n=1 Tax=Polyangium jinanense TaxID=2829994 RepID=A0A9X4AU06_9BACT|nr:hypothetical protein [Polyangium jinanense]MDC3956691.1 hypothetical protein [Polyangium jinanense]MDC3984754.1 hypothetical protein [Polyangium jinanense]